MTNYFEKLSPNAQAIATQMQIEGTFLPFLDHLKEMAEGVLTVEAVEAFLSATFNKKSHLCSSLSSLFSEKLTCEIQAPETTHQHRALLFKGVYNEMYRKADKIQKMAIDHCGSFEAYLAEGLDWTTSIERLYLRGTSSSFWAEGEKPSKQHREEHCWPRISSMIGRGVDLHPSDLKTEEEQAIFKMLMDGAKLNRVLNKVGRYLINSSEGMPKDIQECILRDMDYFLIECSKVNQLLKTPVIKISIDPLHILTMSHQDYSWSSCFALSGCYCKAPSVFVNNLNGIVAFQEGTKWIDGCTTKRKSFKSKMWRQMFIITPDIIAPGRSYPSRNDTLTKAATEAILKSLIVPFVPGTREDFRESKDIAFSFVYSANEFFYDDYSSLKDDVILNKLWLDTKYKLDEPFINTSSFRRVPLEEKYAYRLKFIVDMDFPPICPYSGEEWDMSNDYYGDENSPVLFDNTSIQGVNNWITNLL